MGYKYFIGIYCLCKLEYDWNELKFKGYWFKLIFFILVGNGIFFLGLFEEIFWYSW